MEHKLIPYEAASCIAATSVLVLAPHPDDEVLGCGGAICRHVDAGVPVRVIVATDGALGLTGEARNEHAARRQAESRAAATILGYGEPEFWDLADQSLAYGERLVMRVSRAMAGADLVYAPSILEMHPDHRALGMAAMEALRRIGEHVRLAAYEIGTPQPPNLLLDISPVASRKQAALRCFTTQLESQPYDRHIAALNQYRTYTLSPQVTAAEAFRIIDAAQAAKDPFDLYRPEHRRQAALRLPLDSSDVPLVSVIVRTQGRSELGEALDSVALQTYANIEVVLVDASGAHECAEEICGRFPMRIIRDGGRLDRSRAANVGLGGARGELLIFLDEDDLLLPDHIARLVQALADHAGARAAYAGVRVEGDSGVIDVYDQTFDPARLLAWNHLPIHGVLFERSLVGDGCAFDEDLDLYEDWDFWLQVSRRTEFARAPGVSAVYRAHLGRSALTRPGCEQSRDAARHRIWRKWLPNWSPQAFEALIADFRAIQADQARQLAGAAFTEAELRRILAEERAARSVPDIAALRQEVAALRASTSWRITAPLRALVHLFRGSA